MSSYSGTGSRSLPSNSFQVQGSQIGLNALFTAPSSLHQRDNNCSSSSSSSKNNNNIVNNVEETTIPTIPALSSFPPNFPHHVQQLENQYNSTTLLLSMLSASYALSPHLSLSVLTGAQTQPWFALLATNLQNAFLQASREQPFLSPVQIMSSTISSTMISLSTPPPSPDQVSLLQMQLEERQKNISDLESNKERKRQRETPSNIFSEGIISMKKPKPPGHSSAQSPMAVKEVTAMSGDHESVEVSNIEQKHRIGLNDNEVIGSEPSNWEDYYYVPGLNKKRKSTLQPATQYPVLHPQLPLLTPSVSHQPFSPHVMYSLTHPPQSQLSQQQSSTLNNKISFYAWDGLLVEITKNLHIPDYCSVPNLDEWMKIFQDCEILFPEESAVLVRCAESPTLSSDAELLRQHVVLHGKKCDAYKRVFGWNHLKDQLKLGRSQMLSSVYWSIYVIFLFHSPEWQHLKIGRAELIADYIDSEANPIFANVDELEILRLIQFRNVLRIAFLIIPPHRNEVLLLRIAACLERSGKKYQISSSGQMLATTRRRLIYRREGNLKVSIKKQDEDEEDFF
jgi:hypothetical protein